MMNKEKRNSYMLKGSFHTLEIKSPECIQPDDKNKADCIVTRINENGTEAISKINNDIDLIILDIMMPNRGGITTCIEIRENYDMLILF